MYSSLAQAILTGADEAAASRQVERLRARHPAFSRDQLARALIRRTALRCAAVGALTGAPAAWLGATALAADLPFQAVEMARLAMGLAMIYRRRPDLSERALAAGAGAGLAAGTGALRAASVKLVYAAFRRRGPAGTAPILGGLAGAGLAYLAASVLGKAARDRFRGRS